MTPTSFVLSGPAGTVVADGIATGYADAADAAAALRDGTADVVVGALPFDLRAHAALFAPVSVTFGAARRRGRPCRCRTCGSPRRCPGRSSTGPGSGPPWTG